ncbi:helix-turn-helix domain-containing protein [Micrococcus luteus]|uniref:helix-turn-helix domain-containing protein n=1 Tax=Micrococcus luteus TaxID=1270 RepID=UPI00140AD338|nr:helix-turn-helix domain-containing protein [Micrococcus luteus]
MSGYITTEPNMLRANLSVQECWVLSKVFPMNLVEAHLARSGASKELADAVRHAMRTIHGAGRVHDKEGDIDAALTPPAPAARLAPVEKDVVGTLEAADILGISDGRVRQLVQDGTLPRAPGSTTRRHLIRRADLLAYLQKDAA